MKGTYNIRYDEADLFSPGQALFHHHYQTWRNGFLKRWQKPWSTFVSLCRSFHDSGLHYKVLIIEEDGKHSLQVNAWGTPTFKRSERKPHKPSTIKIKVPAPLTVKRCSRELRDALGTLKGRREKMKSPARLNNPYHYPRGRYEFIPRKDLLHKINRNRKLGKWLARRISTKGRTLLSCSISRLDYDELDAICGSPVTRYSKLYLHARKRVRAYANSYTGGTINAYVRTILCDSFWFGFKTRWASECDRCQMTPIDLIGYEKAKADVDHWTEMLRLVEER